MTALSHNPLSSPRNQADAARLLVVEDHPDTAMVMGRLLEACGYRVRTANTAAAAMELARAEPFDLLLSDIRLPDGTGYELMGRLGQHLRKGIAMSGYGTEEDVQLSRAAGFSEHLVKPVQLDELQAAIERTLRSGAHS